MINCPMQAVPKLHEALLDDIAWAVQNEVRTFMCGVSFRQVWRIMPVLHYLALSLHRGDKVVWRRCYDGYPSAIYPSSSERRGIVKHFVLLLVLPHDVCAVFL